MHVYFGRTAPEGIDSYRDAQESPQDLLTLGPIARLNILVGANNAGKSRLLRSLISVNRFDAYRNPEAPKILARFHEATAHEPWSEEVAEYRIDLRRVADHADDVSEALRILKRHEITEFAISPTTLRELRAEYHGLLGDKAGTESLDSWLELATARLQLAVVLSGAGGPKFDRRCVRVEGSLPFAGVALDEAAACLSELRGIPATSTAVPARYYIPVLRTAHTFGDSTQDDFAQHVRALYSIDPGVTIFTGRGLHQAMLDQLCGPHEKREELDAFERFIGENFFQGHSFSLWPQLQPGRHISAKIDNEPRELHHLGDGVQAIMVLTYQLFAAERGAWIFIEEPEIHCHPGFQRILVDTILENEFIGNKDLCVWFATHSNHILDLSIPRPEDVSVFLLQKQASVDEQGPMLVRRTHNRDLVALDELGVTNGSVFIARATVWVEGITDRLYLRSYLRELFLRRPTQPQEDVDFVFVEYAGSNLSHYTLDEDHVSKIRAQFIANRAIVVADRDQGKERKHDQWRAMASEYFAYVVTEGREIENLLSPPILARALSDVFDLHDPKALEANLAGDFTLEPLGRYLADRLGSHLPTGFAAPSGTISSYYKLRLAEAARQHISWDLMSDGAKRLANSVGDFILRHSSTTT